MVPEAAGSEHGVERSKGNSSAIISCCRNHAYAASMCAYHLSTLPCLDVTSPCFVPPPASPLRSYRPLHPLCSKDHRRHSVPSDSAVASQCCVLYASTRGEVVAR